MHVFFVQKLHTRTCIRLGLRGKQLALVDAARCVGVLFDEMA